MFSIQYIGGETEVPNYDTNRVETKYVVWCKVTFNGRTTVTQVFL